MDYQMGDSRILQIASDFLEKGMHSDDGTCEPDWAATEEQLIEFARSVYSEGYEDGYDQGCYEATGGNG